MKRNPPFWLLFLVCLLINWTLIDTLHLTGDVDTSDTFFFFLAKFGFQKTEILDKGASQGYIYGNVTLVNNSNNISVSIAANILISFDLISVPDRVSLSKNLILSESYMCNCVGSNSFLIICVTVKYSHLLNKRACMAIF